MVFIPIQTSYHCIALGIFDTKKEAENAYIKFLTSHKNFNLWFDKLKKEFNMKFVNLQINNIEDLKKIIFDKSSEDDEELEQFWEKRNIPMIGDIIHEISNKYSIMVEDAFILASSYSWSSIDINGGNHLSNLMFILAYKFESKFSDDYPEKMAKLYPIF